MSETFIADLSAESVRIMLSKPICQEVSGGVVMRAPTVADIRMASKVAYGDEEREIQLFSVLTGIAPTDLERFLLLDYQRLQHAYFLMVKFDQQKEGDGHA